MLAGIKTKEAVRRSFLSSFLALGGCNSAALTYSHPPLPHARRGRSDRPPTTMSSHARLLLALSVVAGVLGQQEFTWGFTSSVSMSLALCDSLPIAIEQTPPPAGKPGVPPFYMISLAAGSTPMTSPIGTNASALSWTVRHPVGTQLILEVVDSQGTSAGIDIFAYTVIAGSSNACLPPPDKGPPFTASSTTPNGATINTCDPWNIFVNGGKPPYTVTIGQLNTAFATNSTMGPADTVLQYINRGNPGSQMIAGVSDSTGRWATGSPFVKTSGSTDLNCTGLGTVSGTNATIPGLGISSSLRPPSSPQTTSSSTNLSRITTFPSSTIQSSSLSPSPSPSTAPASSHNNDSWRTPTIVGASLGGTVVLILSLALCLAHKHMRRQKIQSELDPYPLVPPLLIPMRSSPSSINLGGNSPHVEAPVTPFLLAESGARWSKAMSMPMSVSRASTSYGGHSHSPSTSGQTSPSASSPGAVIHMQELPPPYVLPQPRPDSMGEGSSSVDVQLGGSSRKPTGPSE
ncbi:hypothetical protein MIND_00644500 [Mycena indigotica]|uniref:Uncharacterized protein n=1 Tax=Mycena indigotica TaxID=2126181 RepID=A0A8H6SRK7_9AGAR|nr:uncharacterized protein MIND_00644500 [Mycena indigotica]KAF7304129.1 hypothetical protein MIND_00644500 [Mycena indigotica]